VGGNFVVGLLGKADMLDPKAIEEECKKQAKKEVKMRSTDTVKFDFKVKGQKPVETKGVCQFSIAGADLNQDQLGSFLEKNLGVSEL